MPFIQNVSGFSNLSHNTLHLQAVTMLTYDFCLLASVAFPFASIPFACLPRRNCYYSSRRVCKLFQVVHLLLVEYVIVDVMFYRQSEGQL